MLLGSSARRAFGTTAFISCSNCSLLMVVAHSFDDVAPTPPGGAPQTFLMVMTAASAGTVAGAASGLGAAASVLEVDCAGFAGFIGGGAAGLGACCASTASDDNTTIAKSCWNFCWNTGSLR